MTATNWACWLWRDENDIVRYVGTGAFNDGHPATARWAKRHDDNSPLHFWLQSLSEEPERVVCGRPIMSQKMARALAAIYRQRYQATILPSRGTWTKKGGGRRKEVVYCSKEAIDDITFYPGVRAAARAQGVAPSWISTLCRDPDNAEWHFV